MSFVLLGVEVNTRVSPAASPVPADGLSAAGRLPAERDHDGPDEAGPKGAPQPPLLPAQVTGRD